MSTTVRFHALDAVRAFALLLGVVFHAGLSFLPGMIPGVWAMVDNSPSQAIGVFTFVSHIFRMSLFFLIAGFFARLMVERKGVRGFWQDRAKRILVPLVVGWMLLFPMLAVVWSWGIAKMFGGTPPPLPAEMPPPPPGAFPLTHLWFLYYLLLLYVAFMLLRAVVAAIDRRHALRSGVDRVVRGSVRSGTSAVLLAAPVGAALYLRPDLIAWSGIPTPDYSLIPQTTAVIAFGIAFTFGWLVHRQSNDLLPAFRAQWPLHLAGATVATAVCISYAATFAIGPMAPGGAKLIYSASYAVAIWCWNLGILGLALRFMSEARPRVRYVADASYWIYLVHLPIVVALQVLVGRAPWHWSIKFPLILAVSFTVLFASYHYLVRSTFIGQLLNNRRYPRRSHPHGVGDDDPAAPPPFSRAGTTPPVVILRGVHKRYGTTVALAGLDLDVRRGELLALLGPNGAGKSTAIALCLGLIEADEGSTRLLDRSPADIDSRRNVGVMMQEVGLTPELRVRELIELTASYYRDPLPTAQTLALTRTTALANRPYATLSGGQKRQVQFALAVCGRPALLFLDEPSVGLDVDARAAMWHTIRDLIARGCSIVLTTHYLEEAEALADRVAVLAKGRVIASGTVNEIRSIVSRKQIDCTSSVAVDDVRAWPQVVTAEREADRLRITAIDAEDVLRRLLNADAGVRDIEVRQAGLAEAVADLTKEAA